MRSVLIAVVVALILVIGFFAWRFYDQRTSVLGITSPQAGDVVTAGTSKTISWNTHSIPEGYKVSVAIRRVPPPPLQTEGQEFDPLVFVNLENTGSVEWMVGDMYPVGTYVLSLTAYQSLPVTNPLTVESAPFTIQKQSVGGQTDSRGCLTGAGYSWCGAKNKCIRVWEEYCTATTPKVAVFSCEGEKTITATFYPGDDNYVDLVLSDGRTISLPRALSASGARYAREDGSIVFWNKGDTAFVTEQEETTFAGCVIAE